MPETARMIPFEQVVEARQHDWAWFKLESDGMDGMTTMIRPIEVGSYHLDPETGEWQYDFVAVDLHGHRYDLEVRGKAAEILTYEEELALGPSKSSGSTSYEITLNLQRPRLARQSA